VRRLLATAALAALTAGVAAAQSSREPVACGGLYTIQRGDTLHRIAVRAWGEEANYRTLWRHNRARLGFGGPSEIEVGQVIEVPCLDADGRPIPLAPAAEAAAAQTNIAEQVPEVAAISGAAEATNVGEASVADTAPDLALADSTTEAAPLGVDLSPAPEEAALLALAALQLELPPESYALREGGPVRVGLASPDCEAAQPADATRAECALVWSAPIVEQVAVWHSRRSMAPMDADADSAGLRLCRAAAVPEHLPEIAAFAEARAEAESAACLRAVAAGLADLAVTPAADADAALQDSTLRAALTEQTALTSVYDLRAAAPADDPEAARAIAAINAGIARLRASGQWFAAIDAALTGEVGAN
jgi:polar amino acid transport system substrate-binding protein